MAPEDRDREGTDPRIDLGGTAALAKELSRMAKAYETLAKQLNCREHRERLDAQQAEIYGIKQRLDGEHDGDGRGDGRHVSGEQQLPTMERIQAEFSKRERERSDRKRMAMAQWIGIAVGCLTLLGGCVTALSYLHSLQKRIDAQPVLRREEIRAALEQAQQSQRVVYVYNTPDAGVSPAPATPPRRVIAVGGGPARPVHPAKKAAPPPRPKPDPKR